MPTPCLTQDDIAAILAAYRTGEEAQKGKGVHVRLVHAEEIEGNGFDLNIGRYVRVEAEEAIDLATALAEYQQARTARLEAERRMFRRLAAAGIADTGGADE